ncbi:MAG: guanylate kinase [Cyanobacteria bacterium P01_A01_bin.3]
MATSSPTAPSSSSKLTDAAQKGRLILVTGPSGVGKGTLIKALRERHPDLGFSVSATTRAPREGEEHGVHYYFYSREQFLELRDRQEFLEWAEFAGNCYGTPIAPVMERLEAGEDILLEIELQGARQVMQRCPQAFKIFLSPPSLEELERRLRDRSSDSEDSIIKRLNTARTELQATDEFDVTLVNDRLDETLAELESLIFGISTQPEASN